MFQCNTKSEKSFLKSFFLYTRQILMGFNQHFDKKHFDVILKKIFQFKFLHKI